MKLRFLQEKDAPLMLEWMHDKNVTEKLRANFAAKTLDGVEVHFEPSSLNAVAVYALLHSVNSVLQLVDIVTKRPDHKQVVLIEENNDEKENEDCNEILVLHNLPYFGTSIRSHWF